MKTSKIFLSAILICITSMVFGNGRLSVTCTLTNTLTNTNEPINNGKTTNVGFSSFSLDFHIASPSSATKYFLIENLKNESESISIIDTITLTNLITTIDTTITLNNLSVGDTLTFSFKTSTATLDTYSSTIIIYDPNTGISQVEPASSISLSVFPNPMTDKITIQTENPKNELFNIFNLSGQLVSSGRLEETSTEVQMSHLPSGMYIVKVGQKSFRVIKQ